MSGQLAILCYHRILADGERHGSGRPYFLRGTAVSERSFAAQMRAVAEHFEVLGEPEVLAWLDGERELQRPGCWITFDDGYRDVLERAAPVVAQHELPATVFVTTGVVEQPERWLPADRWYATLDRARRHRGTLPGVDGAPWTFDLMHAGDYARLVDGPERRRYLASPPEVQRTLLGALADALGVKPPASSGLYLERDALQRLAGNGWSIGGHGHTHAILTGVEEVELVAEVTRSRRLLDALGLSPRTFAYPDGACDDAVVRAAHGAGWSAGVSLGERVASGHDGRLRLPRLLARDDPAWIERDLVPAAPDGRA
jgi:peptidoglycan/xylan/chitin deacetylase (PgdA/CDA1 family)